jgi:hypothetical protein
VTPVKKPRRKPGFKDTLITFIRSTWAFPTLAAAVLIILSLLQISGSSIGAYQTYLNGDQKDSALLLGRPQGVRSDEWLVATQLTIAQKASNYPATNSNYSEPKNLGIITDAPTLEWSALFKPQNLAFFFLPFQFAFALKWWLLLFGLIVSAYYFFLRLSKNNILLSILAATIIAFAPFVFWWYQTSTIGPLVYGFIITILSMSIINNRQWKPFGKLIRQPYLNVLKAIILGYFLSAFALILYPPFQIPIAIVGAAFILGYFLNKRSSLQRPFLKRIIFTLLGAIVIAASVSATFVITHSEEVRTITSTAYPGKREVSSGGYDMRTLLVTYLQPQLQRGANGPYYIQNQSESSNFILLPLFFIIPAIAVLVWLYIKKRRIDWILVTLLLCCLLFIAHLFIPLPIILTKLAFLHMVPQSRLLIGLGFLGIILAVYTSMIIKRELSRAKELIILAAAYSVVYFIIIVCAGFEIARLYPNFIGSKALIVSLALVLTIGMSLLVMGRLKLGLAIVAIFSIASVFYIHPLYVGLGPIYESKLTQKVQSLSNKEDVWATAGDILLENVPQMSGRKAITGVNPYPSLEFWKQYSQNEAIYNRYAHVLLSCNDTDALILVQPDQFAVSASCKRPVLQKIDYILSSTPLTDSCNLLVDTLEYPARTFYFYKVSHSQI